MVKTRKYKIPKSESCRAYKHRGLINPSDLILKCDYEGVQDEKFKDEEEYYVSKR